MRRLLMRATVLGLALAFAACAGECAVRVLSPQHIAWLPILCGHPELGIYWYLPNADIVVDTGEGQWRVTTDRGGFRVLPGASAPDAAAVKTLFLGDSFTFAYGVDYQTSFVGLLSQGERSASSLNAACAGYGPVQYRRMLEHLLGRGYRPETVVVTTFLGNDFQDCVWDKTWRPSDQPGRNVRSWVREHSHAYRLLARVYHDATRTGPPEFRSYTTEMYSDDGWTREPLATSSQTFRTELGRIRDLCAGAGARLRLVIIPASESVLGMAIPGTAATANDLPTRRVLEMASQLGIAAADSGVLIGEHKTEQLYFRADGHLTKRGHELVADTVRRTWPSEFAP